MLSFINPPSIAVVISTSIVFLAQVVKLYLRQSLWIILLLVITYCSLDRRLAIETFVDLLIHQPEY